MRKILLASTALVALGVSAASAADITFSGSAKWSYSSWSTNGDAAGASNNTFGNESDLTIATSMASDSGLTYGTSHTIDEGSSGDGQKMFVKGPFGELRFGGDSAGDAFDTSADVADGEVNKSGTLFDGDSATGVSGASAVSFFTNDFNGFKAGATVGDAGAGAANNNDTTEMGLSYTQAVGDASVTVAYATADTSDTAASGNNGTTAASLGATVTMGDLSVTVASNTKSLDNATADYSGTGIGVTYVVSEGLTLKAHTKSSEDDKTAGEKSEEAAASLTYVVAPGLTANVAYTDFSHNTGSAKTTGTATSAYLKVAF